MADLKLDSIEGRTSGTITEVGDLKYQLATAWVNFDGTGTVAIRDSYNVSSITDITTGKHRINFSENMDSVDYVISGTSGSDSSQGDSGSVGLAGADEAPSLSSFIVAVQNLAASLQDREYIFITVFGGKT